MSLKSIINLVSDEKGLPKEIIFNTVKDTVLGITKNKYKSLCIEIFLNKDGTYKAYAIYSVIDNYKRVISTKDSFKTIPLSYAKIYNFGVKVGDKIRKEIKFNGVGRFDTQIAKNIIFKRVKEEEENLLLDNFKDKLRKIVFGIVKYVNKNFIVVNLGGNFRGILYKNDAISKDFFRKNDRVKAYFKEVSYKNNGLELILSRKCDEFLLELLKLEVPEVKDGFIEIVGIARDPGVRSKVALKATDLKLDPIAACIGIGSVRIQNVSKQLCGEKIDLVLWDKELIKYIINIFSDIEIKSIEMDDDSALMIVYLKKNDYLKIVERNFQVVRFAEKLTGWNLKILQQD